MREAQGVSTTPSRRSGNAIVGADMPTGFNTGCKFTTMALTRELVVVQPEVLEGCELADGLGDGAWSTCEKHKV